LYYKSIKLFVKMILIFGSLIFIEVVNYIKI